MFAARANQENAIYEQQTAAAAKPLNQGVKGLAPKTPGNKAPKTPFKVPLNDENVTFGPGKTGGKGKQDGLFGEAKANKVDRSAFVTPGGPRSRAPLGNKTTNAKATAFQTPAAPTAEKPSAKPTSPRMRRAKIKIHEAQTALEDQDIEREVEFAPPPEIPLPDHPDDWPADRTYPQFEGQNLTNGWYSEFCEQAEDDGEGIMEDLRQKLKKIEEHNMKKQQQQQLTKKPAAVKRSPMQKTARDPLSSKPAQSLTARGAASALSKPSSTMRFAAPTAATKSKAPSKIESKKSEPSPAAQGNARHIAAKVASNSTLGYSKGRAVSASKRSPFANLNSEETEEGAPAKNGLDALFMQSLSIADEDADFGSLSVQVGNESEDEGSEVFQLDAV